MLAINLKFENDRNSIDDKATPIVFDINNCKMDWNTIDEALQYKLISLNELSFTLQLEKSIGNRMDVHNSNNQLNISMNHDLVTVGIYQFEEIDSNDIVDIKLHLNYLVEEFGICYVLNLVTFKDGIETVLHTYRNIKYHNLVRNVGKDSFEFIVSSSYNKDEVLPLLQQNHKSVYSIANAIKKFKLTDIKCRRYGDNDKFDYNWVLKFTY